LVEATGIGGRDLPASAFVGIGEVDFVVGLAAALSPDLEGEWSFLAGTCVTFLDTVLAGFDGFAALAGFSGLADFFGLAGFSGFEGLEGLERRVGLDGFGDDFFLAAGAGFLCLAMRWMGLFGDF
jgi:hypothetical protein